MNSVFDHLLGPFAGSPAWAMVVASLLTAVWALLLFKVATPQVRLAAARDRLVGHLFETGLFQDHLRVVGRIQRDLAMANLRYLALSLPALAALAVPMAFTLGQLESRFALRPLQPGEATVLSVRLDPGAASRLDDLRLTVPAGVRVEAGPVRDASGAAAAWRLRAIAAGVHPLQLALGRDVVLRRTLWVGGGLPSLGKASRSGGWEAMLHPGAERIATGSPVVEATLGWPDRSVRYLGLEMPWLLAFMVFSLLGGLMLKGLLRVEI